MGNNKQVVEKVEKIEVSHVLTNILVDLSYDTLFW